MKYYFFILCFFAIPSSQAMYEEDFSRVSLSLGSPTVCKEEERPLPISQFQKWVKKPIQSLQRIVEKIEENKTALKSIDAELAHCLNTEPGDTLIRVARKEGIFANTFIKKCETDFLNPLLNFIRSIIHGVETTDLFFNSDNIKCFKAYDDLYWAFQYSDNPNFGEPSKTVSTWKQDEGAELTQYILEADCYIQMLSSILSYEKLNSFLENFSDTSRAQINIITVGCASDWQQQLYPWVITFAKQKPNLTFAIDLFDKWESDSPEFLEESQLAWTTEDGETYTYDNIKVNIRTYIPETKSPEEYEECFGSNFHKIFSTCVKNQLKNNVVILSQHTGGYVLDRGFVALYNQINSEESDSKTRLFLATHQGGIGPTAYVYHQTPCDALGGPSTQEDLESLIKEGDEEWREEIKLCYPHLWDLKQAYQLWVTAGSTGPSPLEIYGNQLKESAFPKAKVSTLDEVWVQHIDPD